MGIIKIFSVLITVSVLSACGADSAKPNKIAFPEDLPKVNHSLNQDDPTGIWMVYRIHTTTVSGLNEEQNIQGEIIEVAHEMAVIDQSEHEIYTLQFCTTTEFQERYGQGYETLKNGYSYIYSGYENGPDTGSTGRLNVTYLSNLKMYGLGHKRTPYMHLGQEVVNDEVIELYAVKISDEMNFNESDDLVYSSDMESLAGEDSSFNPLCIGTYDRKIKILTNDIVSYENHDTHISQAGLEAPIGFDLYEAEGRFSDTEDQKLVGGWYRHSGAFSNSIESQCGTSDEECLNEHKLNIKIIQNNNSGLSFSARLDSDDGSFLDIEVSAIINPIDTIQ